jgi:hypothetical protein
MKPEPPNRPTKKEQEEFFFEYLLKLVEQGKLSRRQFLRLTSYLAAIGVLSSISKRAKAAESLINLNPIDPATVPQCQMDFERQILRSEDLLNLHFKFYNLNLALNGPLGPRLERVRPGETAYIVVEFPAQNIAEQAFLEGDPNIDPTPVDPDTPPPHDNPAANEPLVEPGDVEARLAGPSRLAFKVPDDVQYIPYTLENLLSWADYEQNVVPVALPPVALPPQPPITILSQKQPLSLQGGPTPPTEPPINPPRPPVTPPEIREPLPCETAIEAPWRLFISPNKFAGWAHSVNPVTHKKRTELWHTRLGIRKFDSDLGAYYVDEEESFYRTIRAIWTSGFNIPDWLFFWLFWQEPFRMSLTEKDRRKIVRLTSDFQISNYYPEPVDVDRLMLTSLGAWIKFNGGWEPPTAEEPSLNIEKWVHRGTMGRDHYVRVVYKGFLFPFGHRASLIKVTERKFQEPPGGGNVFGPKPSAAYLRQRFYIIVRQPELSYPVVGQPYKGREFPFEKIRLTTLVTPNLDDPNSSANEFIPGKGQEAFWPRVGGNDFLFHVVAEDWQGKKSEFTIPLAFVSPGVATTQAGDAVSNYTNESKTPLSQRKRGMSGQKITYAPSNKPGDTSLETNYLVFSAVENQNAASGLPHFYPTMEVAGIRLAAAEQISGGNLSGVEVSYHQRYIEHEFNKNDNDPDNTKNMGEVFVKVNTPAALEFAKADRAGGVVTPNFSIYGISRSLGPIGKNQANGDDLGGWLASQFDPAQYFGDAAKLLGGVLLGKVMKATSITENSENQDEIFKIINRDIYDNSGLPTAIETKLLYKRVSLPSNTAMQADPLKIFEPQADNSLEIKATFRTELSSPNESTFEIIGDIRKFNVNLVEGQNDSLKFITIKFNKLTFVSKKGQKPEIHPDIETVKLGGPLELVNELQKYLKMGSGIEVDANGITALYTLPIPGVAVGIFSLQNLSFSAGVNLPFTGEPARARFAFCERENPFLLTVAMFGGGGFFGIALGLDGLELLEAAFEFGGSLALDIGIASGGVHVLAGVYFKIEVNNDTNSQNYGKEEAHLEGYVRMGGELEVLGIVSLSIEFYMSLSYDSPPKDEVWGQATLVVEIEVLVFSASVEMSVERRFAGSTAVFTFKDLVPDKTDWEEYADAFAPLPV